MYCSLADLVWHKANMLAPFIRAARAAITLHAQDYSAVRHAQSDPAQIDAQ